MSTELCVDTNRGPIPGINPTNDLLSPIATNEHFGDESSSASEHEVEQALDDDKEGIDSLSESNSVSNTSDTSSPQPTVPKYEDMAVDDEEDGSQLPANAIVGTKNEITNPTISLPELKEVDPSEQIERIGEVQSIVDSIVIIRGLGSPGLSNPVEKVLDADSLLVFEDRKVLGCVFETFGPTTLPMYSVRFPSSENIDSSQVQIGRKVFHVPRRSYYVFPRALTMLKGSDASNVHDEEPSIDELEYSDDEAERAAKQRLKGRSYAASRRPPPLPANEGEVLLNDILPYDVADPYALDSSVTQHSQGREAELLDPYDPQPGSFESTFNNLPRRSCGRDRVSQSVSMAQAPLDKVRGWQPRRGARTAHREVKRLGKGSTQPHWRAPPQQICEIPSEGMREMQSGAGPILNDPQTHWFNIPHTFTENIRHRQAQFVAPHINPRFANVFAYTNHGFDIPFSPGYGLQNHSPTVPEFSLSQQQPYSLYNGEEYTVKRDQFE